MYDYPHEANNFLGNGWASCSLFRERTDACLCRTPISYGLFIFVFHGRRHFAYFCERGKWSKRQFRQMVKFHAGAKYALQLHSQMVFEIIIITVNTIDVKHDFAQTDFAWVTLATNDSYSLGALVVANSLKQAATEHQLAVLITPGVTEPMRQKLSAAFNVVQEVNVLDSKDVANLALLARPELGVTFTKLHCWRLTQFEKCVFLDADTLVSLCCVCDFSHATRIHVCRPCFFRTASRRSCKTATNCSIAKSCRPLRMSAGQTASIRACSCIGPAWISSPS